MDNHAMDPMRDYNRGVVYTPIITIVFQNLPIPCEEVIWSKASQGI